MLRDDFLFKVAIESTFTFAKYFFIKKLLKATNTQQTQTIYFHKQPKTIKTQNNNSRLIKDNNNPKHKLKTQNKHKNPI
jgi:hypothetical protein